MVPFPFFSSAFAHYEDETANQIKALSDMLADLRSEMLVVKEVVMNIMDMMPINEIDLEGMSDNELLAFQQDISAILTRTKKPNDTKFVGKNNDIIDLEYAVDFTSYKAPYKVHKTQE